MGGCQPKEHVTVLRNMRREETSEEREEWRCLLREARDQKGL
jgi:hypothetical protein